MPLSCFTLHFRKLVHGRWIGCAILVTFNMLVAVEWSSAFGSSSDSNKIALSVAVATMTDEVFNPYGIREELDTMTSLLGTCSLVDSSSGEEVYRGKVSDDSTESYFFSHLLLQGMLYTDVSNIAIVQRRHSRGVTRYYVLTYQGRSVPDTIIIDRDEIGRVVSAASFGSEKLVEISFHWNGATLDSTVRRIIEPRAYVSGSDTTIRVSKYVYVNEKDQVVVLGSDYTYGFYKTLTIDVNHGVGSLSIDFVLDSQYVYKRVQTKNGYDLVDWDVGLNSGAATRSTRYSVRSFSTQATSFKTFGVVHATLSLVKDSDIWNGLITKATNQLFSKNNGCRVLSFKSTSSR